MDGNRIQLADVGFHSSLTSISIYTTFIPTGSIQPGQVLVYMTVHLGILGWWRLLHQGLYLRPNHEAWQATRLKVGSSEREHQTVVAESTEYDRSIIRMIPVTPHPKRRANDLFYR